MRIAILTNAFPPDARGGAGRIASVYADLLKQHGQDIRVWGPAASFAKLSSMDVVGRLMFHLSDLKAQRETVKEIIGWKPDVLLTHNLTGCGFGTPHAVRSAGIRWVHVLHDVQLIEPSGAVVAGESMPAVRHVWRRLWSSLRHVATKEPDAVASPTKWLLEFHQKFGWFQKIRAEVIPNPMLSSLRGVRDEAILPSVEDARLLRHQMARNDERVLFVGRLDQDKGIDVLLDAWKNVRDVATKLVLIGDGSWKEKIAQLGDPSIDLRGQQPIEQVEHAMRESAVVVMPSRIMENQPTVILEAAAADCRIVATDVGGVRETVGDAGTIVPPNDANALAAAIRNAITSVPTDAERIARERLIARHDPEVAVGALMGLLMSNLYT